MQVHKYGHIKANERNSWETCFNEKWLHFKKLRKFADVSLLGEVNEVFIAMFSELLLIT